MLSSADPAQSARSAREQIWSTARPAWLLTREVLATRASVALLAGAAGLSVVARALQPLGISASRTRADELACELGLLLCGCLTLLVLVRSAHWRAVLEGFGTARLFVIIILTVLYLDVISQIVVAVPNGILFSSPPALGPRSAGEALWLSSLAGILALSRLEARTLGLSFLLLAAWVPVFGTGDPARALGVSAGVSDGGLSVDVILPMLVPHLLALGYVCLERVQR